MYSELPWEPEKWGTKAGRGGMGAFPQQSTTEVRRGGGPDKKENLARFSIKVGLRAGLIGFVDDPNPSYSNSARFSSTLSSSSLSISSSASYFSPSYSSSYSSYSSFYSFYSSSSISSSTSCPRSSSEAYQLPSSTIGARSATFSVVEGMGIVEVGTADSFVGGGSSNNDFPTSLAGAHRGNQGIRQA